MIPAPVEAVRNTSSAVEDLNSRQLRKKDMKKQIGAFLLLLMLVCTMCTVSAQAAVHSDEEAKQIMDQAFSSGDLEVVIEWACTLSVDQNQADREVRSYAKHLEELLSEVALKNGRLLTRTNWPWQTEPFYAGGATTVVYKFNISSQNTKKVKVLTSEKSAYRQALTALKKRDYSTNFYSEDNAYFETFKLALQHHPEYNYGVGIWKSSDGTCGYRNTGALSNSGIKKRMAKADAKADAILKSIIKKGMTKKEKLQAIHDYLVRYCQYDEEAQGTEYSEVFTAYGCLVRKKAVCQGYAAAFNLLAGKAGISSIMVAGTAGGGSHAWNYIKNGSNYYYIDVTWDDPLPDRGSKASVPHKYFYVDQKMLSQNHQWNKTESAKKYVDYAKI